MRDIGYGDAGVWDIVMRYIGFWDIGLRDIGFGDIGL